MNRKNIWSVKGRIVIGFTAGVVVLGLLFVIWRNVNEPALERQEDVDKTTPDISRLEKLKTDIAQTMPEPPPSKEDVEQFMAFLDELGEADDYGSAEMAEGAADKPELSYEEELKQRLIRIMKTPEWRAFQVEQGKLQIEQMSVDTPEALSFYKAAMKFELNHYSVLGIATHEEGQEMQIRGEISKQDLEYIKEVGRQFQAKNEEYYAKKVAIMRAMKELHRRKLELLGMTHREFSIAISAVHDPPPLSPD